MVYFFLAVLLSTRNAKSWPVWVIRRKFTRFFGVLFNGPNSSMVCRNWQVWGMSIQGLWEPLIAGYANDCHPLTKDVCSLLSADSSDDHSAVISLDSFDCVHIRPNIYIALQRPIRLWLVWILWEQKVAKEEGGVLEWTQNEPQLCISFPSWNDFSCVLSLMEEFSFSELFYSWFHRKFHVICWLLSHVDRVMLWKP